MYRHKSMCLQKNVCKLVFGLYTNEIVFDETVCPWPPYLKDRITAAPLQMCKNI